MATFPANAAQLNEGPPVWPGWLLAVYLCCLLLLLFVITAVCVTADSAERLCLDSWTPFVGLIVAFTDWCTPWLSVHSLAVGSIFGATVVLAALGGVWLRRSKGVRPGLALAAVASAVVAQAALFGQQIAVGGSLYALAGILLVVWRLLPRSLGPAVIGAEQAPAVESLMTASGAEGTNPTAVRIGQAPTWLPILEAVALTAITALAALYYFYALNQLPDDFDGELAAEMAVSTSWHGVMKYSFPTEFTPSGLFYRLFHYVALNYWGTTLLAARIVSAWSGVLIVVLMYGFLRRVGGVPAALAGALLLATDPIHLVWSRADMFPYAYPSLVAIPLCWATYVAVTTKRLSAFLLTALLMAASCHVFPSGATVFLVPLAMAVLYLLPDLAHGRQRWRTSAGLGAIGLGAGLWLVGISVGGWFTTGTWRWVNPGNRNPDKALWLTNGPGSFGERIPWLYHQVADNVHGFLQSVFVTPRWMYHYTPIADMPNHAATFLPPATALLSAIGFVVCLLHPRRRIANLLVFWVLVASLPGILSTEADARRLGTIFPALIAMAALTLAGGFRLLDVLYGKRAGLLARIALLGVLLPLVGLLHGGYYFRRAKTWPGSTLMARSVQPYLTPGTMVLMAIAPMSERAAELNYLLLDHLRRNAGAGWHVITMADWPTIAFHPRVSWDAYYYQDTFLRDQVDTWAAKQSWSRFVVLVQDAPVNLPKVEFLHQLFPDAEYQHRVIVPGQAQYNFHAFVLSPQMVQEVSLPLAKVVGAPAGSPPDPSRVLAGTDVRFEAEPATAAAASARIVIRAGLWQEKQAWESIRIANAADATISIDGHLVQAEQWKPLVPGVHTLEVSAPLTAPVPLALQTRSFGEESFQPLAGARLLGPQVADVSALRPVPILPYPGYDPAVDTAPIEAGFGADFAVSPSGRVALLGVFGTSWKVRISSPDGQAGSAFEARLADGAAGGQLAIAFAGDEQLVLLQAGKLNFFDLNGNLQQEVSLPSDAASWVEDIAANAEREVFVASSLVPGLLVFDNVSGQFSTVERPGAKPSRLMRLSATSHDRVAALDSDNNVNLYVADGRGPHRWRWVEGRPSGMQNPVATVQLRRDGWLFVRHGEETEIRVFDPQRNQRIADEPLYDLTTQSRKRLMGRILGFDDKDNLYSWTDGYPAILRSSPRPAQP